jgi:hypothetical protein
VAAGTKDDPWELTTPPGTSSYTMYQDDQVLVLGLAELTHDARNNKMRAI